MQIEHAQRSDLDVIAYLGKDLMRNALDIWYLQREEKGYELLVCRVDKEVKAHLGVYNTPEANYVTLGGDPAAAGSLITFVPSKAVLLIPVDLQELIIRNVKYDTIYSNELMIVERGNEKLSRPELATRLSTVHEIEYSRFGSSFNVPPVPIEWIRERLENDIVFGVFDNGVLGAVASVAAWLPEVAVIMGVETKPELRRRGLGTIAVSAAVQEGLKRSRCCTLFVRSDNEQAISLYNRLGFEKVGKELWVDINSGLKP